VTARSAAAATPGVSVRASTFWLSVLTRALSRSAIVAYSTKITLIPSSRQRTRGPSRGD
jgi:hypothetical protein